MTIEDISSLYADLSAAPAATIAELREALIFHAREHGGVLLSDCPVCGSFVK